MPTFFGSGPWRNESVAEGYSDSTYSSAGGSVQDRPLQVWRDCATDVPVIWHYTVPSNTKVTAQTLVIEPSPGGTWGVWGLSQASYERLGILTVTVDGVTVWETPVNARGSHEEISGGQNLGPNTTQHKELYQTSPNYGDGIQLTSGQVLAATFTPQTTPTGYTGQAGCVAPCIVNMRVSGKNTATGAPIFTGGLVRGRDTTAQTVMSYTVGAQGITIMGFTVLGRSQFGPGVSQWIFLKLNGEVIHEFLSLDCTPREAGHQGMAYGMTIPLWGAEFFSGDRIELVGSPWTDTGGHLSAYLCGTSESFGVAISPSFNTVSPTSGTVLAATTTPVTFHVANPSLLPFTVWVRFTNEARAFLVYDSLSGFRFPFAGSTVTNGGTADVTFSVVQTGGWQDGIAEMRLGGVA